MRRSLLQEIEMFTAFLNMLLQAEANEFDLISS